jgi:formylglycine-generating enzyme
MQDGSPAMVDATHVTRRVFLRHRLGATGLSGVALLGLACLAASSWKGRGDSAITSRAEAETGKMVWIPAGRFLMGSDESPDAMPVREIELRGFWIDRTEVTNAEFARFVAATGYLTVAERPPDPQLYPGVAPALLVPGSIVFTPPEGRADRNRPLSWWAYVPGADWRHPEGPGSTIEGRENHPVVQVCWDDAVAYAEWAGKRLPTEAEWEYAARGGLEQARYVWGDQLKPGGHWPANIYQGCFPARNTAEDGFASTAPIASFPPNGFGLYDMSGNVWEWCADWYHPDAYSSSTESNPTGPLEGFDPEEPGVAKRVQRGGSFLCSNEYCVRYLAGARGKGDPGSAASHTGFRCVRSGNGPGRLEDAASAATRSQVGRAAAPVGCCEKAQVPGED